jgi:hypothetical protein
VVSTGDEEEEEGRNRTFPVSVVGELCRGRGRSHDVGAVRSRNEANFGKEEE